MCMDCKNPNLDNQPNWPKTQQNWNYIFESLWSKINLFLYEIRQKKVLFAKSLKRKVVCLSSKNSYNRKSKHLFNIFNTITYCIKIEKVVI